MNISGIDMALLRFCLQQDDGPKGNVSGEAAEILQQRNPADYEWLKKALASVEDDNERIKKYLAVVADEAAELEDKEAALEQVQYLVEDLDLANDLAKRGLGEVTQAMFCEDGPGGEGVGVRAMATWVLGTLVQNNAFCQEKVLEQGVFSSALQRLLVEKEAEVQAKLLMFLSGMVRECEKGVGCTVAKLSNTPDVFCTFLSSPSQSVRLKTRLVCTHLLKSGSSAAVEFVKASGIDDAAAKLYAASADALEDNPTENEISMRLFLALTAAGITDALASGVLPVLEKRVALLKGASDKDMYAAELSMTSDLSSRLEAVQKAGSAAR